MDAKADGSRHGIAQGSTEFNPKDLIEHHDGRVNRHESYVTRGVGLVRATLATRYHSTTLVTLDLHGRVSLCTY